MARRGVMTALQAALAGIGGAAGGVVQQEELKRKRRAEEEARTRQEMRDIIEAGEREFVTGEQLAKQQEQGKRTTGSVVQNALLSALSPRAGVLPPPTAQDVGLASQALATAGRAPQRIVTAGGQEMFRAETPFQREERLGVLEREQKRMDTLESRRIRAQERSEDAALEEKLTKLKIDADKQIAKIRADVAGNRPVQRPTEGQEKSFQFAQRMTEANKVIEQFGPNARLDRVTAALASTNPVTTAFWNRTLNPQEQQLVTAIRQFAEPILRKNTGAAFNQQEIRWVEQQVIPLSGDSDENKQYKSGVRSREIDTFNQLATPARLYYESVGGSRPPLSQFER